MSKAVKPLLAGKVAQDLSNVRFPCLVSPKLDGIRCIVIEGVPMSRKLKRIPNLYVQSKLDDRYTGLDGELIQGDPTDPQCYLKTNSATMSIKGEPDFTFYVFDSITYPTQAYIDRHKLITKVADLPFVKIVQQHVVHDMEALLKLETEYLELGYEGIMVRSAGGHYKFGRSTDNEGVLLKLKRMESSTAEIVGMVERMHNNNEAKVDALGHTERSTAKAGLVPAGDMGTLRVRDIVSGVEFEIGTGFTAKDRVEFWENLDGFIGKYVEYNHFPIGAKDLPRFPSYKGMRAEEDISN